MASCCPWVQVQEDLQMFTGKEDTYCQVVLSNLGNCRWELSSNIGTWCLLVLQLVIRIVLHVDCLKWRSSIWKWRGGIWRRVVMSPPW